MPDRLLAPSEIRKLQEQMNDLFDRYLTLNEIMSNVWQMYEAASCPAADGHQSRVASNGGEGIPDSTSPRLSTKENQ